ncbi:cAMP-binding domain of CRP or a regulatory subunit of cAMP-dependent protein kinases [Mucilaginibacter mallensis]|uniref:cAMP-binding domain of CRP or a regulatory subunit of cAMP-dependent protein kinases n=1 Tax=Mucilaginibacter mallensis TaxID=652787 RepID=A0A1H1W0Y5_MUCMA|nr:Crp/Fnr family transcriptional regulator [Mucilaginibacter mallensis]SDS90642.1 cAMP-binding domain of CRP or a regulatory subunit of cAMP-dependent protein kinases [Mucilaginibacter mallensis]
MVNFIDTQFSYELNIDAKTQLLKEGDTAQKMFFIKKGSLRVWFNNNGTDVTAQFFFEGDAATSLDSFINNEPSLFTIEAMEPCEIAVFNKSDFDRLLANDQAFKDWFYQTAIQKLLSHSKRLLSFIKNKPMERYQELIAQHPAIFQRVPQRYIASYLGITPVSLSRIRNRKVF